MKNLLENYIYGIIIVGLILMWTIGMVKGWW